MELIKTVTWVVYYFSSCVVELLSEFLYLNGLYFKENFEIPHCSINVLIYPLNFHLAPLQWLLRINCLAALWEMRHSGIWIDENCTISDEVAFLNDGRWKVILLGAKVKTWFLEMHTQCEWLTWICTSDSQTFVFIRHFGM